MKLTGVELAHTPNRAQCKLGRRVTQTRANFWYMAQWDCDQFNRLVWKHEIRTEPVQKNTEDEQGTALGLGLWSFVYMCCCVSAMPDAIYHELQLRKGFQTP